MFDKSEHNNTAKGMFFMNGDVKYFYQPEGNQNGIGSLTGVLLS
jgi:hypothetical protein